MNGKVFIDTNIFIYLYADNERDKQEICRKIVNQSDECITSTLINTIPSRIQNYVIS